jgi:hypothetical protein
MATLTSNEAGVKRSYAMVPLHRDPFSTFQFGEGRIIPRFHVEGVWAGTRVGVFRLDPATGDRLGLIATAAVGDGGWVDLPEPLVVRAGDSVVVVPDEKQT